MHVEQYLYITLKESFINQLKLMAKNSYECYDFRTATLICKSTGVINNINSEF